MNSNDSFFSSLFRTLVLKPLDSVFFGGAGLLYKSKEELLQGYSPISVDNTMEDDYQNSSIPKGFINFELPEVTDGGDFGDAYFKGPG